MNREDHSSHSPFSSQLQEDLGHIPPGNDSLIHSSLLVASSVAISSWVDPPSLFTITVATIGLPTYAIGISVFPSGPVFNGILKL